MRLSLFTVLCGVLAAGANAADANANAGTLNIGQIIQSLSDSKILSDPIPAVETLLSQGGCDVTGCVDEVTPIVTECLSAINSGMLNFSEDFDCLQTVTSTFSSNLTDCVTCFGDVISTVQSLGN